MSREKGKIFQNQGWGCTGRENKGCRSPGRPEADHAASLARLRKPMQALPAKGRPAIGKIFLKDNTIHVQIRKQGKTPPAAENCY
jgi:hypothetical protein